MSVLCKSSVDTAACTIKLTYMEEYGCTGCHEDIARMCLIDWNGNLLSWISIFDNEQWGNCSIVSRLPF